MTKKAKKPAGKITKAGAVELEENELDDIAGGTETISLNYSKIDFVKLKRDTSIQSPYLDGTSKDALKISE